MQRQFHLPFQPFKKAQNMSRRQAKWTEWLESYYGGVDIQWKEGKANAADPLSRRPDLATMSTVHDASFLDQLRTAYDQDPYYLRAPKYLRCRHGMWYMHDRIAVPPASLSSFRCCGSVTTALVLATWVLPKPFSVWLSAFGGHTWLGQSATMWFLVPPAS